MTYTLYTNGVLEKDGFVIPIDEMYPDYREYVAWVALGNVPESQPGSVYLAKLEADKQILLQVKAEYVNMITRLGQIQAAVNPTNAQVIQAIKDEALYIERIMKFLRRLIT